MSWSSKHLSVTSQDGKTSIDQFVNEEIARLEKFRDYWKKKHAENPDNFPLALPSDDEGVWSEMFDCFNSESL